MSVPIKGRRVTHAEFTRLFPHYPSASQRKTFHAAAGSAIAAWQIVEANLYEVYRATTGARRPGAEAAAFYSLEGFRAQLKMTDAAVRFAIFDNEMLLDNWKKLLTLATDKSKWRNQIAHGTVWFQYQELRHERKIYIGANISDPREGMKRAKLKQEPEPLTLRRVSAYGKDFVLLARQLDAFARRIPQP